MQKVHFRLTSVAQKRCCLNSLIWSSENAMDARERRDSKPPLRAFLLLLVFLKVLRFSFPVPVVSSRSLVRFWRRKHKKSTTRFPSLRGKRLKTKKIPGAREARKARDGEGRKRVPAPSSLARGLASKFLFPYLSNACHAVYTFPVPSNACYAG